MLILAGSAWPVTGLAQDAPPDDPLAPFAAFVDGRWHLDGSSQELRWGPGRRSVLARGYLAADGEDRLVSQGMWFWHPGEQRIVGYFTAVDMTPDFFAYVVRFEGAVMVGDVIGYSRDGEPRRYVERWEPLDADRFRWSLREVTDTGEQQTYDAVYTRH
jgi:hypothetical protein